MGLKNKIKEKYDSYKNAFKTDGAADLFPYEKPQADLVKSNSHKWQSKTN